MYKLTIYLLLLIIPTLLSGQNIIDRSLYNLTFEETFNELSDKNDLLSGPKPEDHWQFHPKYETLSHSGGGIGQELYKAEMVNLVVDPQDPSNKMLVFNAEKYDAPFDVQNVHNPSETREVRFKSGMLQSKNFVGNWPPTQYGFEAYGIFEARIQLPPTKEGKGSFWLFVGGDEAIEIDIVEESHKNELTYTNNVHDWTFSPSQSKQDGKENYLPPLADDFHVFSVVWTPDRMSFYIDDEEQRTITDDEIRTTMDNGFHLDMILSLNPYEEEGTEDDTTTDEYDMKVDWIKVWKYSPGSCCPEGTVWDGAHCEYTDHIIPPGYEPFIRNNNLYTEYGSLGEGDCPPGAVDDGAKCTYQTNIPSQYDCFIWPNDPSSNRKFFAHANCQANPELCCPAGSTWDGAQCQYDRSVPEGFEPFIGEDNGLYVFPDASGMCPAKSTQTPLGCYLGVTIPTGIDGFIYNGNFYSQENCDVDQCCPEGTSWNGETCVVDVPYVDFELTIRNGTIYLVNDEGKDCPFGTTPLGDFCNTDITLPSGFEGIEKGEEVHVEANCESCCPEGFTFDGEDCVKKITHLGIQIFPLNGQMTTISDCEDYEKENDCCPEGFYRNGYYCILLESSDEYAIEQNGFESKITVPAEDCLSDDNTKNRSAVEEYSDIIITKPIDVTLYPNPSSDKIFLDYNAEKNELQQLIIYSATGNVLYSSQSKSSLIDIKELPVDLDSGVYMISLKFENEIITKKIIKL